MTENKHSFQSVRILLEQTSYFPMRLIQASEHKKERLRSTDEEIIRSIGAIKARTLLNVAYNGGQLSVTERQVYFWDPVKEVYFATKVHLIAPTGDLPLIDFILNLCATFQQDGVSAEREAALDNLWNTAGMSWERLYPEVSQAEIGTGDVKSIVSYNSQSDAGWAATRGWMYVFNYNQNEDLALIHEWLSLSDPWLGRPSAEPSSDDPSVSKLRSPNNKTETIKKKRREAHHSFQNALPRLTELTTV